MEYVKELLRVILVSLNKSYADLVTNGNVNPKSHEARLNRDHVDELEKALIVLDGEFVFEQTPLGKRLIVSNLDIDKAIVSYIAGKSLSSGVDVENILVAINDNEITAYELQSPGNANHLEEIK